MHGSEPDDSIVLHIDILSSPNKQLKLSKTPLPGSPVKKVSNSRKSKLERIPISKLLDSDDDERAYEPASYIVSPTGNDEVVKDELHNSEEEREDKSSSQLSEDSDSANRRRSKRRKVNKKARYADSSDDDDLDDEYDDNSYKNTEENKAEMHKSSKTNVIPRIPTTIEQVQSESFIKRSSKKALNSNEHNFTSPLKKAIMKNLKEYAVNNDSFQPLKLTRNFEPTPVPDSNHYKPPNEKKVNSFFDTYEGYLDQKKQSRGYKSNSTMADAPYITREEFALITNAFNRNFQKDSREELYAIQEKQFPQYWFELTQGFSLLFYGVGSKRKLLEKFVLEYLSSNIAYSLMDVNPKLKLTSGIPCIVVNGYNPICNYRDVSKEISKALYPEELSRNETKYWGNHVLLQIQKMIEFYKTQPPDIKLIILIHNLDGPSVRKDVFQLMLSNVARIRQVAVVASTDHVYAPILWDNAKAQDFNFIFHDVTNFEPAQVESSFQDIMKLGKSEKNHGAEGSKYVLQSLTSNSKKMYKLLVETQLRNMETASKKVNREIVPTKKGTPSVGVEFRTFLQSCSNDFIASNEISLRNMLTEFYEHKMANLTKNSAGTEHIWISYNYTELKKLLVTVLQEV